VPNLDFYAVGADHAAVLDAVFALRVFRVFESYSEPDMELREFTTPDQVPATRLDQLLSLYVIESGPEPVARRMSLRPGNALGNATFRCESEGWGLLELHLGSFVDDGSELRRSHINHNTERAPSHGPRSARKPGTPGGGTGR
jgi:hypothetical protein